MKPYILEACVDSVKSALIAASAGANRLELCANLIIGGTTPSLALYEEIRKECDVRTHILIRPRFGDFCYSEQEVNIMEREIELFRNAGAQGVVIGILTPDGNLNKEHMKRLIDKAGDMHVTLHRAFDMCADPFRTYQDAVELGVKTILTSGQKQSAIEGMDLLKQLISLSQGNIEILMGAGISADAIEVLQKETGNRSYHMSGKVVLDSKMIYRKAEVSMGLPSLSEYDIWQTSKESIQAAVKVLERE